jgi:hypothetical protein
MTQVEVDEVLGLMCHEAAKVASNNAVPGRSLSLVKCALDMLGNILLNGELGHGLLSDFDSLLLHILGHVGGLDLSFKLLPRRGALGLNVGHRVESGARIGSQVVEFKTGSELRCTACSAA